MADIISPLTSPNDKVDLIAKLNEIIDWLNGTTVPERVTEVSLSGYKLSVKHIDGSKDTLSLQDADTTYSLVTSGRDGLMRAADVVRSNCLTDKVAMLDQTRRVLKAYWEYKSTHHTPDPDPYDYESDS